MNAVCTIVSNGQIFVVTGLVKHSQIISAQTLKSWFAAEKGGLVNCAHCTRMAGLGEACSHVGTLLFAVEASACVLMMHFDLSFSHG